MAAPASTVAAHQQGEFPKSASLKPCDWLDEKRCISLTSHQNMQTDIAIDYSDCRIILRVIQIWCPLPERGMQKYLKFADRQISWQGFLSGLVCLFCRLYLLSDNHCMNFYNIQINKMYSLYPLPNANHENLSTHSNLSTKYCFISHEREDNKMRSHSTRTGRPLSS